MQKKHHLLTMAFVYALLFEVPARTSAILGISEPSSELTGVITVSATGVPAGAPGVSVITAANESIHFTYDDLIPSSVTGEFDRMMLEPSGSPSDLFVDILTQGSSVESVFFFSDNETGGGLPATCTPSAVCTILTPIAENGSQQTVLTIVNPVTQALVTTYTAASDLDTAVPEASTMLLLGIGFVGLGLLLRGRTCGSRAHPRSVTNG